MTAGSDAKFQLYARKGSWFDGRSLRDLLTMEFFARVHLFID
jgi:hypothetical protein